ncbi:MAG TPA: hypothetical protein VMN82_02445, partial [Thermoanaerobaculia bacterium]|nr:hypothetical protein [Thermoanaerobaculia bacterium]
RGAPTTIGRAVVEASRGERAALFLGLLAAFVAAVEAIDRIRLDLLLDPEPSWLPARLTLLLVVAAAAGSAGVLAASLGFGAARSRWGSRNAVPLPLDRSSVFLLGAAILAIGVLLRIYGAGTLAPLYFDELSEVRPAAALRGALADVPPWTHPVPFREGRWGGSVGTLYLETFRLSLRTFGTTIEGVRAPSVLGGILSLFTAALLGRAFLPRGGGMLTILALAGMRWNLIVSQWGWNAVVLAPILDLAALAMLEARRRERVSLAVISGSIAGLGAHVYLASWIGAAALGLWATWPSATAKFSRRAYLGGAFLGGFLLVVFPLVRDDPFGRYFSRTADNSRTLGFTPVSRAWWRVQTAEAAVTGPWWTPDGNARHDLPGRSRLGWIVGAALAAALLRAILHPRDELSAYLLASAACALLASMAWGRSGTPNTYRSAYLSTTTALAAAAGVMWLLSAIRQPRRRLAAGLAVGALAISGALGARDALLVWPVHRATFDGFGGGDTLLGQAASRWDRYGTVRIDTSVEGSRVIVEAVRASRVAPFGAADVGPAKPLGASIRLVGPGVDPGVSERVVERIRDGWGREYGRVLASSLF